MSLAEFGVHVLLEHVPNWASVACCPRRCARWCVDLRVVDATLGVPCPIAPLISRSEQLLFQHVGGGQRYLGD
jgi:hypothetical protein